MPNMPGNAPAGETGFDAIRLNPGAVVQIQDIAGDAHTRHEVRYIGHIRDKSLLLTLPHHDGADIWLQPGMSFVMRGFNGIHAYVFSSQVLSAQTEPFRYAHFSWPHSVACQLVRHALRVEVSLRASIVLSDGNTVDATMRDLSVAGATLDSKALLGAVDHRIRIGFSLAIQDDVIDLYLPAIIRNINRNPGDAGFRTGIGFENITQNDGLALYYYTHTQAQKIL